MFGRIGFPRRARRLGLLAVLLSALAPGPGEAGESRLRAALNS